MAVGLFWLSIIFVFYVYAGYPLLVSFLAKIKKTDHIKADFSPKTTLIIAAYNEEDYIAKKLENSLNLDFPKEKLQIIVAADGSFDQTAEIVRQYAKDGVELAYVPERSGKMSAINRAMQFANGDIVIFSDANNMYEPKSLRFLTAPFAEFSVGATTGAKLIIQDGKQLSAAEGLYWRYESWIKANETFFGSCTSAVGGEMLAVRRNLFIAPPNEIINDDHYIVLNLMRHGYRIVYTPEARSFEHVSTSPADEVIRRSRMNAGLFQTIALSGKLLPFKRPVWVWQIISHKFSRGFVPFAMLAVLLTNLSLVIWPVEHINNTFLNLSNPWNWIFFGGQLLFYSMALIGQKLKTGSIIGKILYLPKFLLNSNIAVILGLYKFIMGKQSHIWERVSRRGEKRN